MILVIVVFVVLEFSTDDLDKYVLPIIIVAILGSISLSFEYSLIKAIKFSP